MVQALHKSTCVEIRTSCDDGTATEVQYEPVAEAGSEDTEHIGHGNHIANLIRAVLTRDIRLQVQIA